MSAHRPIALALSVTVLVSLACGGPLAGEPVIEAGEPSDPERLVLPDGDPGLPALPKGTAGFSAAPALRGTWVKGEAIDVATDGHVVIVEAWATWCGPCREQFPHLSTLQSEHGDTVRVVAVSDEGASKVKRFVKDNAEIMEFSVVADGLDTWDAYEVIGRMDGIPHAYLVRDGHVMWNGHPAGMDPVLAAVLAGTWTAEDAELSGHLPEMLSRYVALARAGEAEQAAEIGAVFLESSAATAGDRNNLSWTILTEIPASQRDRSLALALAEKAVADTERQDWAHLDTLALALFENGDRSRAIKEQEVAVRMCLTDGMGTMCDELKVRLAEFRRG